MCKPITANFHKYFVFIDRESMNNKRSKPSNKSPVKKPKESDEAD